MLKVSRILTAVTLYQGDQMSRNFTGKYLLLTTDPKYASMYNSGPSIKTYEIIVPPGQLFSLKSAEDLEKLSEAVNNPDLMKEIMAASTTGELDWSAYDKLKSEQYGGAEGIFKGLGYSGVWLGERARVTTLLVFDQHDVQQTGAIPKK